MVCETLSIPSSRVERVWNERKVKKQTYDLEERLLEEKMNIEHRTSNIECRMKDKNKGKNLIKGT